METTIVRTTTIRKTIVTRMREFGLMVHLEQGENW